MTNSFSNCCLELFSRITTYDNMTSDDFLNLCVENRLNNLVMANSRSLDNTLTQLEHYIDDLITDSAPYVRCNNYKQKQKSGMKYNINYIGKLFKKYNKSCISSTRMLNKLMKRGSLV